MSCVLAWDLFSILLKTILSFVTILQRTLLLPAAGTIPEHGKNEKNSDPESPNLPLCRSIPRKFLALFPQSWDRQELVRFSCQLPVLPSFWPVSGDWCMQDQTVYQKLTKCIEGNIRFPLQPFFVIPVRHSVTNQIQSHDSFLLFTGTLV